MDDAYKTAMQEQLAQLAEELQEISDILAQQGYLPTLVYRATERNLQLLVEACIGIAKHSLKAKGLVVPNDSRQAFAKLKAQGMDSSTIDWNKVIGMRNVLVHDYLNLEQERIVQIIRGGYYLSLLEFAQGKVQ